MKKIRSTNTKQVPAGISAEWENRLADLWASIDDYAEEEFLVRMEALLGELASGSAVDVGREREALSLALSALARHLPRYQRSLANYAQQISDQTGRNT